MDDLAEKLNDFLSSPDSMQKIQAALAAFGAGDNNDEEEPVVEESEPAGMPDSNTLSSLLSAFSSASGSSSALAPKTTEKPVVKLGKKDNDGGLPDLSMITKLIPLMSSMNRDDEDTVLLKALRPYLHGDREKRLDEAIKILRFMKVMPLLKDKGLF